MPHLVSSEHSQTGSGVNNSSYLHFGIHPQVDVGSFIVGGIHPISHEIKVKHIQAFSFQIEPSGQVVSISSQFFLV